MLRARGYPCSVKRHGKNNSNGCGFSVVILGDCESAAKVLDMYNIPYSSDYGGDAGNDKL